VYGDDDVHFSLSPIASDIANFLIRDRCRQRSGGLWHV